MKRYDLELTATGPVMEERKEGAFVPFSEVSGLADTVMKMGDRCQLLADLLREVTKIVPAIGVAIDDLPAVDAFLERIEAALAGQELERIGSNALAMMMDELHDICVGLDAPGGAQNGAEAWDQVKGARDRVLAGLHQDRPDTEWTDATTSPVAADYRELQEQHDQLQSTHKGTLVLLQEAHEVMRRVIPSLPQDCAKRGDLLDRIEVALAGKQQNKPVTITETIRTAPERIWLQVGDQSHYHSEPFPSDTSEVSWCADSVVGCEVLYVRADLAGKLPDHHDQHPDDAAVDHFAVAMKAKLTAAREKGRGGWDDPSACSVEFLADLLVGHVGKGNQGNFEDIANLAMMLHQRGADPAVLAHAATLTTCTRCEGHGIIGGVTGQTPESMDFWEADCPDCDGRGKAKVKGRTLTEGQEFELAAVLQSIANGFSDDPAHDAAALLKRIAGEVQWTGDSFQLPPRQGGEPCDSASLSSSPD